MHSSYVRAFRLPCARLAPRGSATATPASSTSHLKVCWLCGDEVCVLCGDDVCFLCGDESVRVVMQQLLYV